jgi:hypothetical protein
MTDIQLLQRYLVEKTGTGANIKDERQLWTAIAEYNKEIQDRDVAVDYHKKTDTCSISPNFKIYFLMKLRNQQTGIN